MKLINNWKFMGPIKDYKLTPNYFIRTYAIETRQRNDILGHHVAEQVGVPTTEIISVDARSITFRLVEELRLDQLLVKRVALDSIKQVGQLLGRLHRATTSSYQPDMTIIRDCILSHLIALHSFGDTPSAIHSLIIQEVDQTLQNYEHQQTSSFIHGDFTPQNIFAEEGIRFFDWENSCYSDPMYDLATFTSFCVQLIAKNEGSYFQVLEIENSLLAGYKEEFTLDEDLLKRYTFYKVFDRHTMYWFYLALLSNISNIYTGIGIQEFLDGYPVDIPKMLQHLHYHGYGLKRSSIERIHRLLSKSKKAFQPLYEFRFQRST